MKDPYAQRSKLLTSTAQRIRGWVGSDPARTGELADALVELTAHRLLGHGYAAAATDAQEAAKLSAQLLTANGPLGPYTDLADATRYATAVVQFATVQVGLGLPDAAGRSIASLSELYAQLGADAVIATLSPQTAVWALLAGGRAALAGGDVATANASADAAQTRLAADADAYLVLDVDRLSGDARWAAARPDDAVVFAVAARQGYDAAVDGRLAEPARLSAALRERLAEPLTGVYGDLADRLYATGDRDLALSVRQEATAILAKLAERWLEMYGAGLPSHELTVPATATTWEPLTGAAAYGGAGGGSTRWPELSAAARSWLESGRASAAGTEAQERERIRVEGERRAAEAAATEAAEAERRAREQAAAEQSAAAAAAERAAAEEAEREETKRRRAERIAEHRRLEEVAEAERLAVLAEKYERERAQRVADDPAELERQELARLQAELDELEQPHAPIGTGEVAEPDELDETVEERREAQAAEQAREAARQAEVEAAEREAQRLADERADAEAQEAKRLVDERAEALAEELAEERARDSSEQGVAPDPEPEPDAEPAPEDDLVVAQRRWDEARSRGDRRAARTANERVVELLRPRAEADLTGYGPRLVSALEDLSRSRLRGGDIFGSRGPAKEAKALARRLGS